MVQIVWVKNAIQDLNEISEYIARYSPKYADSIVDRIFSKTQILKEYIEIGRIVPEINNPLIREIFEGNYRIIYEIKDKREIEILYYSSFIKKTDKIIATFLILNSFRYNKIVVIPILLLQNAILILYFFTIRFQNNNDHENYPNVGVSFTFLFSHKLLLQICD
jgi:toxin ParE1/3/4